MHDIGHLETRVAGIAVLVAVTGAGAAFALDEAAYGVVREPWGKGLCNHRAVVRVEQKAEAVQVEIPWRRRDRDPERELPRRRPAGAARILVLHFDPFVLFPLALKR